MNYKNGTIIEENDQYRFILSEDNSVLMFDWKHIKGLVVENFQSGIIEFAAQCKLHKPTRAVIDAVELDQNSPAVAWLRGKNTDKAKDDYQTWWAREIVPMYHDSGIVSLAVGTGDPSAPGELPETPPEINFKIGYFTNFESAMQWKVA